ncbi:MAG: T9SS type A sorting domain-containing protein [Bacteroidetes bacterium]|nr:T9SS type A sorting domain-containing protein [Bacteroidota bacterium]
MRNLFKVFVLLLVVLIATSATAGTKKQQTILSDKLQVLRASVAPTIDGQLDPIWKSVTAVPMLRVEGHALDTIISMHEHFAKYRAMWDDDNLYLFVEVIDSSLRAVIPDRSSPWNDDCIEVFLDGKNNKGTTYDTNCVQWRWVYPELPVDTGKISSMQGEWAYTNTPTGYNFEIAIPSDKLPGGYNFLGEDNDIGFEISNGDRSADIPQRTVIHWWTNNGLTWQNPSLFGTATLVAKEASPIMNVYKAEGSVTIDGQMDVGEWDVADEVTMNQVEGGRPLDSLLVRWQDHMTSFRAMWDDDNLYLFVTKLDSSFEGAVDKSSPWNNDCIEVFLDGKNNKGTTYDTNCVQWRWVYPELPADTGKISGIKGEWATQLITSIPGFGGTITGVNFEIAIPKEDLPGGYNFLAADNNVGFEVSSGSRAGSVPQKSVLHWWTTNGLTWQNPSLFGTILLVDQSETDVETLPNVASEYRLKQNYPNPFNPSTKITYSVPTTSKVRLTVYNILGMEVAELVNGVRAAGTHEATFSGHNLASGVYFYRLQAGNIIQTKKMLLLK